MDIVVAPRVERYLDNLVSNPTPLLRELQAAAEARGIPDVGVPVGRLLEQYARLVGARRVIELGSGVGYSGAWLARGMTSGGHLHLIDDTPEFADTARVFAPRFDNGVDVTVTCGDALAVLEAADGAFDIIFNDCEKTDYPRVYALARTRLRRGGLLISDNTLWGGAVAADTPRDAETAAIQEYNRLVVNDPGFATTILPLRDGVAVSLVL